MAVAAYYPSAAAFTPAILLSFVAAGGAVAAAYYGFVRIAIVTLLVVAATVLVSPVFLSSFFEPHIGGVMLGSAVSIAVVGLVLLRRQRQAR